MEQQQQLLVERLDNLRVEEGHSYGLGGRLLTVFPLHGARRGCLEYVTLEMALAAKSITISELDEPQVNALAVTNRGDLPVLITDGDTLVGGQQNRVVNSTILVPPGRLILPVSCVERGRWRPETQGFALSESAYPALRRAKGAQVARSLRTGARHQADQGAIWKEVAERQSAAAVRSSTEALRDLYHDRHDRLTTYVNALPCTPETVGVIVGYGGRIVSLEVFDSPDTLGIFWPRLIRAAALDVLAHEPRAALPLQRAVRMLHRPQKAAIRSFPSPGMGEDIRILGNGVEGAALFNEGILVHAVLHRITGKV